MASLFQGFDIVRNLSESDSPESDRSILDNLGGGAISNDLLTFYNNLRNTSIITVEAGDITGSTIVKSGAQFVFTNGTEITVGSTKYYVKDSDSETTFRLSTSPDLSTTVSSPPTGDYIRSDAVTIDNLINLAIDRERVVEDISGSRIYGTLAGLTDDELYRLNTSLLLMLRISTSRFPNTAKQYLAAIDSAIDLYEQRVGRSIIRDRDFTTSFDTNFKGVITVVDTGNLNDSSLPVSSNPGVFITNPRTGEYSRAFSSNENVWSENSANLVADATGLIIGNLEFTGLSGISLLSKDSAVLVENVTSSANLDFTHTIDVEINGEVYSLCLYQES